MVERLPYAAVRHTDGFAVFHQYRRGFDGFALRVQYSVLHIRVAEDATVYADKGYDSKENRQHLEEHRLLDGIMRKAHRNRPLTEAQTKRNRYLSKTRYVVEQSFGTLHRKFRYARAAYFGLCKVSAQSHLKAMCLNLLKAANRLSVPVAA